MPTEPGDNTLWDTTIAMGTVVTIQVVDPPDAALTRTALQEALGWFATVERICSRFDPRSELRQLIGRVGEPVSVSPILFEATRFALELAVHTAGAFDPTIGRQMEQHGFDQHYATGERVESVGVDGLASYRDVQPGADGTLTLCRPLVLDLGAVAKGLAIDLAAQALHVCQNFCIEAGGDVYVRGDAAPDQHGWRVGVQSPDEPDAVSAILQVSDVAVCTSGGYRRPSPFGPGHHLLNPRTGSSASELTSVTVLAPTAMAADGLSTAAFILGNDAGHRFLDACGVSGVFMTAAGELHSSGSESTLSYV